MVLADKLDFNPSYGAVLADLIGYSVSIFSSMYVLYKKYGFNYGETIGLIPKYIISWLVFIFVIEIGKLIVPINLSSRLLQIPILSLFGIFSFGFYLIINYRNGNMEKVFGSNIDKILKKIVRK